MLCYLLGGLINVLGDKARQWGKKNDPDLWRKREIENLPSLIIMDLMEKAVEGTERSSMA